MRRFLVFVCVLLVISCGKSPSESIMMVSGETMGTTYSVKYVVSQAEIAPLSTKIKSDIDIKLDKINQLMSTYIVESELSNINRAPANQSIPISSETAFVISKAIDLYSLSNGKLDITIGPLVNLWGFGPEATPIVLPDESQLANLRTYVGIDKFKLTGNSLVKLNKNVYIDLSTIAKGYAVDVVVQHMRDLGFKSFMVEIGGELYVQGSKPNQKPWLIAIEKPVSNERALQKIIAVENVGIASSGDYRNYFEKEGIRYSHLIDPTTGYPIQHNLVAVTVLAESAMMADGLATALNVMGKDEGLALADSNDIAALFITKEGDDYVEYASRTFYRKIKEVVSDN